MLPPFGERCQRGPARAGKWVAAHHSGSHQNKLRGVGRLRLKACGTAPRAGGRRCATTTNALKYGACVTRQKTPLRRRLACDPFPRRGFVLGAMRLFQNISDLPQRTERLVHARLIAR
jgi:hypothetical protein